jgi:hypothetical protein
MYWNKSFRTSEDDCQFLIMNNRKRVHVLLQLTIANEFYVRHQQERTTQIAYRPSLAQLRQRGSHNCQQYEDSESSSHISRDRGKITIIRTPPFSIRIHTQNRLRRDGPVSAAVPCPRIRSHWRILETGRISSHMALQSSISRVFLRGFLDTQCSG